MSARSRVAVRGAVVLGVVAFSLAVAGRVRAEAPVPRVYDRMDAAWDSYQRAEARRRQSLGLQLEANDALAWRAGAPTYAPYPPDLETIYAYGPPRAYRGGLWRSPVTAYRGYPGVLEPWPFVPGDIYGYPYVDRVEQPRGHVVIPYGLNGYYYGPVYDRDLLPRVVPPAIAEPPAAEKPSKAPPQAIPPGPEPVPAPRPERGPRGF